MIQNKVSVVVVVMKKVGAAVWSFLLSVMLSSLFSDMVSRPPATRINALPLCLVT